MSGVSMKLPLNCFVCDRALDSALPTEHENKYNQPAEGTRFTTRGHYGSTVFDPMSNYRSLEICICDLCMVAYKERIAYVIESPRSSIYEYLFWDPTIDD